MSYVIIDETATNSADPVDVIAVKITAIYMIPPRGPNNIPAAVGPTKPRVIWVGVNILPTPTTIPANPSAVPKAKGQENQLTPPIMKAFTEAVGFEAIALCQ